MVNWPQWRGPEATGATAGNPPLSWSESHNVRWKTPIPGRGHSSPIVWGDRVYTTTAISSAESVAAPPDTVQDQPMTPSAAVQKFALLSLDRATGAVVWERELNAVLPHEGTHELGSWASQSPVTDGERIYAFFGSRGLFCVDRAGAVLWSRQLGEQRTLSGFGEASSPLLLDEVVVVNWDHEDLSFTIALDKRTGEKVWRVDRDETTSWSTPLAARLAGATQVVTSAKGGLRAYDAGSGRLIWSWSGFRGSTTATAIVSAGVVYFTSSYEDGSMVAINLNGAQGDLTDSDRVVWLTKLKTPYVASPLLHDGTLYIVKDDMGYSTASMRSAGGFWDL